MAKLEYKKEYKDMYVPKKVPVIVTVPSINFIIIEGTGDPNGEKFALATAAPYSFSYAVKMSYKSDNVPISYYDYTVLLVKG